MVDDEPWPIKDDEGTINVNWNEVPEPTIILNDQTPTATVTIDKCIGKEVLVRGHIQATRVVEEGRPPRVNLQYQIDGWEWWGGCSTDSDEWFGGVASPTGGVDLFDDGIDNPENGAEIHRISIDWTNNADNNGGDTVKGVIAVSIQPVANRTDAPLDLVRLLRVQGQADFKTYEFGADVLDSASVPLDHAMIIPAGAVVVEETFDQCGLSTTGLRMKLRAEIDPTTYFARVTNEMQLLAGFCPGGDLVVMDSSAQTINVPAGVTTSGGSVGLAALLTVPGRTVAVEGLIYTNAPAFPGGP